MNGIICNVFVENNISRCEKMVSHNGTYTIPTFARRVAHEIAFTGLGTEFGLLFLWHHGEATSAPNTQVRNVGFPPIKHLKRCHTIGKIAGRRKVLKIGCCQCSFSPVSHWKLSSDEHGLDFPLNCLHILLCSILPFFKCSYGVVTSTSIPPSASSSINSMHLPNSPAPSNRARLIFFPVFSSHFTFKILHASRTSEHSARF